MNVLVSLYPGYGLGDAVSMSAVLRHVVAARPGWRIDYQAEEGKHQVGRGIVAGHFARGAPAPSDHYDAEVQVRLYDTWHGYTDRPNTVVSSCLHDCFGLPWRAEYGRYRVDVRPDMARVARAVLYTDGEHLSRLVAVHYQGDSSQDRKNLTSLQALDIGYAVERMGLIPLILDWRARSGLPFRRLTSPPEWGRDAEMVCAVIGQCRAFIGIDSGPAKCAAAIGAPALVVWTGHHPAPHFDPAPGVTHLVPCNYHGLDPVRSDSGVVEWFDAHYETWQYDHDLVKRVRDWLEEVTAR